MQKLLFIKSPVVLLLLLLAVVLLTTVGGCLYAENRYYKKENRQLIIQNDSIISVNIELKSALKGKLHSLGNNAAKKTGYADKKENSK